MKRGFSGIILSGGLNKRMGGRNKSLIQIAGQSFLQRLISTMNPLFQEIILVTRQPEIYIDYDCRIVKDIYQTRSSLTGIHAGLLHASCQQAFIAACDIPLLKRELIQILLQAYSPEYDIAVPRNNSYYEPLCAVYSKSCIPNIEKLLQENILKISSLYTMMKVKEITAKCLREADPELESFLNINTPQDLVKIRQHFDSCNTAVDKVKTIQFF